MKHNNVIPNGHFKKKWQFYVKTWFNQPARKVRRRAARAAKAEATFPRPTAGSLRPVVRGAGVRYNFKVRAGRGFSLEELKAAGIPKGFAKSVGIAVDHRRKNRSLEGLQDNVQRLKAYKASLVLFPVRANKPKAADASAEECKTATQLKGTINPHVPTVPAVEMVEVTQEMKDNKAYATLRLERMNARMAGIRKKRADDKAAEEKDKA